MATVEDLNKATQETVSTPVVESVSVDTPAPVAQPTTSASDTASLGVPTTTLASSVVPPPTPQQVYSPANIQAVDTTSPKKLKSMKLDDLEKTIAKAQSTAELNQANIQNQTIRMGVMTGQSAHQARLDNARLNALTGMFNAKQNELARKEAFNADFLSKYGADPSTRPKGMSVKEFQASLLAQGNTPLQLEQQKLKQSLTGGGGSGVGAAQSSAIVTASQALNSAKGEDNYTNPYEYIKQRDLYIQNTPGATYDDFDSQFAGMLNPNDYPTVGFNPAQIQSLTGVTAAQTAKQQQADEAQQSISEQAARKVADINDLIDSKYLNNAVGPSTVKWFSRSGLSTLFNAGKKEFIGGVNQLIDQETLSTLLNLKAQGGTLGAISQTELNILQNSASKLNTWAVKDKNGNVVGYNVNEAAFIAELQKIKESQQRLANLANTSDSDPLGLGF